MFFVFRISVASLLISISESLFYPNFLCSTTRCTQVHNTEALLVFQKFKTSIFIVCSMLRTVLILLQGHLVIFYRLITNFQSITFSWSFIKFSDLFLHSKLHPLFNVLLTYISFHYFTSKNYFAFSLVNLCRVSALVEMVLLVNHLSFIC